MAQSNDKLALESVAGRVVFGLTTIALAGCVLLATGCAEGTSSRCVGCNGCCLYGQCLPGNAPTACGHSSQECVSCATGNACVNGECVATAGCGPGSCAGCCYGDQCVLVSQQDSSTCGSGGVACQPCNGPCMNGYCQSDDCGSSTCSGCCTTTGQCLQYPQQNASQCGRSGILCQSCSGQCTNGQCVSSPTCTAATCSGCCTTTGQCLQYPQQNASQCGRDGNPCQACLGTNESCLDGSCQGTWKVLATSAQVTNKPTGDWDETYVPGGGPLPDPVLECKSNSSQKKGTSSYVNDTLSPNWGNTLLFSETEANLAGGVTCDVYDDDTFIVAMQEHLGQCTFSSLTPLGPGPRTSNTCTSYVTQITISFSRN